MLDGASVAAAPSEQAHRLRDLLRADPERARTTTASASRSAWRSRATAPRSTSPASARARSASTTPPQLEADTFTPSAANQIIGERRRTDAASSSTRRARSSTCSRASTTRSRSSTPAPASRSAHVALHNPEPASVMNGRPLLYDTTLQLEPRRLVVRELPHLRRLRQPRLGPRQSRRRRRSNNPGPFTLALGDPRLPSDEGPHDDAEPARHGEPRPDALARRSHRRQRFPSAQPNAARSTRTPRSRSSTRRSKACSAASAQLTARRDAGVHRLHPAGDVPAEPDPRISTTR